MKRKILCIAMATVMLLSTNTMVDAKHANAGSNNKKQTRETQSTNKKQTSETQNTKKNERIKEKKQSFKISGSPVIKYGKYKLPINPVVKGMGATVDFDKTTAILTVTKGTTTIVINFKEKTATVNGVADTKSGLFTAKNDKKMTVLIKYIANELGVRVNVKGDKVTTEIPGLDLPTAVTVTPVGGTVIANTVNSTTTSVDVQATIVAGQAVGGKAELYVGSKLIATDATIEATDATVTFTTTDKAATNAELQALISEGGVVTVKLYNASQQAVVSAVANPTLTVDYVAPVIASISSATYSASGSAITVTVSGAGAVNDKVDVTKLTFQDTTNGTAYQLTNTENTGSTGVVTSDTQLTIKLGSADQMALERMKGSTVNLTIAAGSLLIDKVGNTSASQAQQIIPVTITN